VVDSELRRRRAAHRVAHQREVAPAQLAHQLGGVGGEVLDAEVGLVRRRLGGAGAAVVDGDRLIAIGGQRFLGHAPDPRRGLEAVDEHHPLRPFAVR
jgi:hypothetical protein